MSDYFANRCWGCKEYNGFISPYRGEDSIVDCMLGHKNISLSLGCSDFNPDNTASCQNCFYQTKKEKGNFNKWHCMVHNITTMRTEEFPGNSGYCQEFYHKDRVSVSEKKKGCFITTATCSLKNKPDDCYELEILRKFRDEYLNKYYPNEILEYYRFSPIIVDFINKSNQKKEIYKNLWQEINKCISHIENKENELAFKIYGNMFIKLKYNFNLDKY